MSPLSGNERATANGEPEAAARHRGVAVVAALDAVTPMKGSQHAQQDR